MRKLALTEAHIAQLRREVPDVGPPPGMQRLGDEDFRAMRNVLLERWTPGDDFHVFAYGSLIWNPACAFIDQTPGTLVGWHRRFCFRINRYRGTDEQPGLMMTLDRGGSCRGVLQRLPGERVPECLDQLLRREFTYKPTSQNLVAVSVQSDGRRIPAIAMVINRKSPNYAADLSLEQQAEMIALACGYRGPCAEYLLNTVEHLEALGIHDRYLWRLQALVAERISAQ